MFHLHRSFGDFVNLFLVGIFHFISISCKNRINACLLNHFQIYIQYYVSRCSRNYAYLASLSTASRILSLLQTSSLLWRAFNQWNLSSINCFSEYHFSYFPGCYISFHFLHLFHIFIF